MSCSSSLRPAAEQPALLNEVDRALPGAGDTPFPPGCRVALDIGFNDGADTSFLLSSGFCVLGVDANPATMAVARKRNAAIASARVKLLTLGLEDEALVPPGGSNLTFWVPRIDQKQPGFTRRHNGFIRSNVDINPKASFQLSKVPDPHPLPLSVPVARCDALYCLLGAGVRAEYVKIDIVRREPRHPPACHVVIRVTPLPRPACGL